MKKIIRKIIFIVALCVFVFAAYNLISIFLENNAEKNEINELRKIVDAPETEEELEEFDINFDKLQSINSDVVGWIIVEDTEISYPVVQGNNNDYYLNHTFEKNSNYAGAIFMDYRAAKDLSDYNTFIYGHNVFHGTMFAELENYAEVNGGEDFYKKHPYVFYYTPNGNYKLQVYSAYVASAESDSYRMSFNSLDDYNNYLFNVKSLSRYDTGVEMSSSDKMITLYTCSYEDGNNPQNSEYVDERYFIHCKIIKALKGELPYNN